MAAGFGWAATRHISVPEPFFTKCFTVLALYLGLIQNGVATRCVQALMVTDMVLAYGWVNASRS